MHKAVSLLLFLCACDAALGQRLSYGLIVGSAITNDFSTTYETFPEPSGTLITIPQTPAARGFLMEGATLEWRLTRGISVEGDAIFREIHYNETASGPRDSVVTWEFPILAKYQLPTRSLLHPFVEGGPSLRTAGNLNSANPSTFGVTAGAGLEFQFHNVTLSPGIRYTRWERDHSFGGLSTKPDQIELLVSLGYTPPSFDHPIGHRLSFGVMAGTNLLPSYSPSSSVSEGTIYGTTDTYVQTNNYTSGPRSVIGGAVVNVQVLGGLAAEVDALAHVVELKTTINLEFNSDPTAVFHDSSSNQTVLWLIPVLAKYTLPVSFKGFRSFVESGPSFRIPLSLTHAGFTTGTGLSRRFGWFEISPALRYTHWQSDPSGLKRDQVDLLVGLSF